MRKFLFTAIALALGGLAHADTYSLIPMRTQGVKLGKVSGNGAYAVGGIFATAGFRWTAADGKEELITTMDSALGINNLGTLA